VVLQFENNKTKNYCSRNIVAVQQDLQSESELAWEYFRVSLSDTIPGPKSSCSEPKVVVLAEYDCMHLRTHGRAVCSEAPKLQPLLMHQCPDK